MGTGMQHGVEGKDEDANEKKRAHVEGEEDWRVCQWPADQDEQLRLRHQDRPQYQQLKDENVESDQQQQHYRQPQEEAVKRFAAKNEESVNIKGALRRNTTIMCTPH